MVDLGWAAGRGQDTTAVGLEVFVTGSDCNVGWSLSDGSLDGASVSTSAEVSYERVRGDSGTGNSLGGLIVASSIFCGVWVIFFFFESVLSSVLVSPVVPSAVASTVEVFPTGAVDELLFREQSGNITAPLDGVS